jgi:hypothetical protein
MATTTNTSSATPAGVVVGVLSEAVIPGGSHLVKGDLREGAVHFILGIAAGMALGPLGVLVVKANSLAKATTGQSVTDKITG